MSVAAADYRRSRNLFDRGNHKRAPTLGSLKEAHLFLISDIRVWVIMFGAVALLLIASVVVKIARGKDLDPPETD
jgi:hypothetical protein